MRHLYLMHKSGQVLILDVEDAQVRKAPGSVHRFDLSYTSDTSTVLFLRTENFDAAVLRDGPP